MLAGGKTFAFLSILRKLHHLFPLTTLHAHRKENLEFRPKKSRKNITKLRGMEHISNQWWRENSNRWLGCSKLNVLAQLSQIELLSMLQINTYMGHKKVLKTIEFPEQFQWSSLAYWSVARLQSQNGCRKLGIFGQGGAAVYYNLSLLMEVVFTWSYMAGWNEKRADDYGFFEEPLHPPLLS